MIDPAAARHGEAPSSRGQRRTHEQAELGDMTCMENTPSSAPSFHGRVSQQAMHEAGVGHEEEADAGLKEHQQAELMKLIQGGRALLFTPRSGGRSLTTFKYLSMELWELVITCHVHEVRAGHRPSAELPLLRLKIMEDKTASWSSTVNIQEPPQDHSFAEHRSRPILGY
ncbi:hypothetical protein Dimus_033846 [Dionaea muscipula]